MLIISIKKYNDRKSLKFLKNKVNYKPVYL